MTLNEGAAADPKLGPLVKEYPVNTARSLSAVITLAVIGIAMIGFGIVLFRAQLDASSVRIELILIAVVTFVIGGYRTVRAVSAGKKLSLTNLDVKSPEGRHAFWGAWLLAGAVLAVAALINIGVVLGLIGLGIIALAVRGVLRDRGLAGTGGAIIYKDGFTYPYTNKANPIQWADISELFLLVTNQGMPFMTIYLKDGTHFEISSPSISNLGELLTEISTRFAEFVVPDLQRSLKKGQPILFGPVTLTKEGISSDSQSLSWSETQAFAVSPKGDLTFGLNSGKKISFRGVKATEIPNMRAFELLCTYGYEQFGAH